MSIRRTSAAINRPTATPDSKSILEKLGPGLITGAADDDPSGIAAYSQGGAQFGFSLLWTLFLTYPLMVAIQLVGAKIGRVSGYGLAGNIRRNYPAPMLEDWSACSSSRIRSTSALTLALWLTRSRF